MDCMQAFLTKLQNLQRKVNAENVSTLVNLSCVLDDIGEEHLLDSSFTTEIIQHLKFFKSELNRHLLEFKEEEGKLVRNPFSGTLDVANISNAVQDAFLDLKNEFCSQGPF